MTNKKVDTNDLLEKLGNRDQEDSEVDIDDLLGELDSQRCLLAQQQIYLPDPRDYLMPNGEFDWGKYREDQAALGDLVQLKLC